MAVPTTGQSASSIFLASGSLTLDLRTGHCVAVVEEVGTGGCEVRLWWWSVVAPTTGHWGVLVLLMVMVKNLEAVLGS